MSRALKDKDDVIPETKKKIKECAEEMGYVVNASASLLRSGESRLIALLVDNLASPENARFVDETTACAEAVGYSIILFRTNGREENEKKAILSALSRRTDGVLVRSKKPSEDNLKLLRNAEIPLVFVGGETGADSSVEIDYIRGGFLAAEHLIMNGHDKILVIGTNENSYAMANMCDGIKSAFMYGNRIIDDSMIKYVSDDPRRQAEEIDEILNRIAGFSAVICSDDIMALQVIYLLKKRGLAVPEDVSVIGFGNVQQRILTYPLLTTVEETGEKESVASVELLLDKINGKESENRIIPVKLVKRESTSARR